MNKTLDNAKSTVNPLLIAVSIISPAVGFGILVSKCVKLKRSIKENLSDDEENETSEE